MSIISDGIWSASPSTTRGQPTSLSSDPKGERIAYASNKSIFLRSIDRPEKGSQYNSHIAKTTVARFSPSGFYVASGDESGTVRIWDCVGEGSTKGEYPIIAGRINDIAWDGDSQRIIAVGAGKERFGHCITADSGNSVGEISGHSSQINCVSIRQQRPLRAATGSDDTSVAFFHGVPFKFNTSVREKHNKFIYGTAFSPDGASLVTVGADRKIWLYDGKTGEPQRQIGENAHKGSIFGVSWSKDSKSFVTASADQTVKIWDAEVGEATQSWRLGDDNVVSIPDQQVGVVWPHGRSDGLIISVDLQGNLNYFVPGTQQPTRVVYGHQRSITALSVVTESSDTLQTLVTGSSDGRVLGWDVASGKAGKVDGEGHSNYIAGAVSDLGRSRVHTIGWDDSVRSVGLPTLTFAGKSNIQTSGQPKDVVVSSKGLIVVATSTGFDIQAEDTVIKHVSTTGFVPTCLAASSTSDDIACSGGDNIVRIISGLSTTSTTVDVAKQLTEGLKSNATALAFSQDGAHLAVGTANGGIVVYKTSDWSLITSRWSSHTARVTSVAWSADGLYAVSGSLDTNIFVWSLKSPGKRVKAVNAHKDGVNCVSWLDADRITSAGADATIKVWKVQGLQ